MISTEQFVTDIAWAAGLFEGEGCIDQRSNGENKVPSPRLQLVTTDKDVLERFTRIVGGNIYGPFVPNNGLSKKQQYKWATSGVRNVQQILRTFWPHLGERRRAKAAYQFAVYYEVREPGKLKRQPPRN